ncbi:hypothetical protein BRADI_1g49353v3 [Brachypodium distachyon]|uniref:Ubiquitin-like domain-containing protein n=1 Tax=Brachypodium distachyon TaxID=15368 RepID=A0A2K2DQJ7_BRADI|nr:hypothetical protein BRADI_1g49353v3 [Brachypodium distachyon]
MTGAPLPTTALSTASPPRSTSTFILTMAANANKALALDVQSSDTIRDVKAKIYHKLPGNPVPSRQRLVFAGKMMEEDGRTLEEYGVKEESRLHLAVTRPPPPVGVFVRAPSGKRLYLRELELSDTVWSVKEKISDEERIPPGRLRVVYGGKQLEDGSTLADCNVRNGTLLTAILRLGCRHCVVCAERVCRPRCTS